MTACIWVLVFSCITTTLIQWTETSIAKSKNSHNCSLLFWCGFIMFLLNYFTLNFLHDIETEFLFFFSFSPQYLPWQLSTPSIGRIKLDRSSRGLVIGRALGTLYGKRSIHHQRPQKQENKAVVGEKLKRHDYQICSWNWEETLIWGKEGEIVLYQKSQNILIEIHSCKLKIL